MKKNLSPGISGRFRYVVPEYNTVPRIYEEAEEFRIMPRVFTAGFIAALFEWVCSKELKIIELKGLHDIFLNKLLERNAAEFFLLKRHHDRDLNDPIYVTIITRASQPPFRQYH